MLSLPICLIVVLGPFGLDQRAAVQMFNSVTRPKLLEANVNAKLVRVQTMRNILPAHLSTNISERPNDVRDRQYYRYRDYSNRRIKAGHYRRFKCSLHYLLPPMVDGYGGRWLAGVARLASKCGKYRGFSVSNATTQSREGEPRTEFSGLLMSHELAHVVGARHIETPMNLMSPWFPRGAKRNHVPVLRQTEDEIRKC